MQVYLATVVTYHIGGIMIKEFSFEVQKKLGYYIYAYFEPNEQYPFYIGKGKGNRVFSHLIEAKKLYLMKSEDIKKEFHEKSKIIMNLFDKGVEPRIEILHHGLDENEAKIAEAVAIDLFSKDNLTNIQRGYHSKEFGRTDISSLIMKYDTEEVTVEDQAILITINTYFDPDMETVELYDRVRSCWKLSKNRAEKAEYVFAVYQGKILEVYKPVAWIDGFSTMRADGVYYEPIDNRIEFVGRVATEDVRAKYKGKKVKNYIKSQNPCQYINC